jgi:hypothetical protein
VVPLADERLRRLERRLAALEGAAGEPRLDQAIDVLTRLVRVVAAHHAQTKRTIAQLGARTDRMTRGVATGRTGDLRRLALIERRLLALERQRS